MLRSMSRLHQDARPTERLFTMQNFMDHLADDALPAFRDQLADKPTKISTTIGPVLLLICILCILAPRVPCEISEQRAHNY
jgi:hypothetical protein